MFKTMGTYDIGMTKIYVGQQNIKEGTVDIKVNNKIVKCPMHMDVDNDIFFAYHGNVIYFRYLK